MFKLCFNEKNITFCSWIYGICIFFKNPVGCIKHPTWDFSLDITPNSEISHNYISSATRKFLFLISYSIIIPKQIIYFHFKIHHNTSKWMSQICEITMNIIVICNNCAQYCNVIGIWGFLYGCQKLQKKSGFLLVVFSLIK